MDDNWKDIGPQKKWLSGTKVPATYCFVAEPLLLKVCLGVGGMIGHQKFRYYPKFYTFF